MDLKRQTTTPCGHKCIIDIWLKAQICEEKAQKESRQRLFLHCSNSKRGSGTCVNDSGPGLYVDAGSSLPGPEDPHERLSGEDAGCFTHLYIKQSFPF